MNIFERLLEVFQQKRLFFELVEMLINVVCKVVSEKLLRYCDNYPYHNGYYPHQGSHRSLTDVVNEIIDEVLNNSRVFYKYFPFYIFEIN